MHYRGKQQNRIVGLKGTLKDHWFSYFKDGHNVDLAFQTRAKLALAQESETQLYHEFADPMSLTNDANNILHAQTR